MAPGEVKMTNVVRYDASIGSPSMPGLLTHDVLSRATKKLASIDPGLEAMVEANGVPPLWGRPPGFATLIRIILEQQVSLSSASAAYRRLSHGVGRVTPASVLGHSHSRLTRLGLTRQKARYCRELADGVVSGRLDLTSLTDAGSDHVRQELTSITGIGRWTADIYLLMALRRPDIWPRGDLALYQAFRRMTNNDHSPEELDEHACRWRPWRAVAARVLWHQYLCTARRRLAG
jgi:DNA-3-methyladenine glycosylase II